MSSFLWMLKVKMDSIGRKFPAWNALAVKDGDLGSSKRGYYAVFKSGGWGRWGLGWGLQIKKSCDCSKPQWDKLYTCTVCSIDSLSSFNLIIINSTLAAW